MPFPRWRLSVSSNIAKVRWSKHSARVTAEALAALGRAGEAAALRARYGLPGDRQ
jgi:hypothetical protein